MQLYVGCSGWSYDSWLGHFYPKRLESRRWLEYYSKVFDYVEIDSTFYRTPNRYTTVRWANMTPDNFRFTAKCPQVVTHDTRLGGGLDALLHFFEIMKPLENKLGCLLMQLPPSLKKEEGLPKLERLIPHLWKKYRFAVEVRHKSWFDKDVYDILRKNRICLAWSQLDAIQTPPEPPGPCIQSRSPFVRAMNPSTTINLTRFPEYFDFKGVLTLQPVPLLITAPPLVQEEVNGSGSINFRILAVSTFGHARTKGGGENVIFPLNCVVLAADTPLGPTVPTTSGDQLIRPCRQGIKD